jgi:hypothetical protein
MAMEYIFEELILEEIVSIKLPLDPSPVIPKMVFEDISLDDIKTIKKSPEKNLIDLVDWEAFIFSGN